MRNQRARSVAGRGRRLSLTVMVSLLLTTLFGPGMITAAATPPTAQVLAGGVTYPTPWMFSGYPAGETKFMGFPSLYNGSSTDGEGERSERYILSHATQRDTVGLGSTVLRQSRGGNFEVMDSADGYVIPSNFVRLGVASGAVYGFTFEDRSVIDETCTQPSCRREFDRWLLAGDNWQRAGKATINFPTRNNEVAWARIYQGPILAGDGKTLITTVYGRYNAQHGWAFFSAVADSTNDGVTWTVRSELAVSTTEQFGEASVAPTSDGGLIAVIRKDENLRGSPIANIPANVALYVRRSSTQSAAGPWTPLDASARLAADGGNSPSVELLGNGALVIGSGRPDNVLRVSYDGRGIAWSNPYVLYRNTPTTGGDADGWYSFDPYNPQGHRVRRPMRHLGSSTTMGIEAITGNQLLVVGDNCASGWGCPCPATAQNPRGWECPQRAGGYPKGTQTGLWRTTVTVDNGRVGRLDLPGMFRRDELTVLDPTFSRYGSCATPTGCRQSYAAFAFDGDARSDTSTVTPNRSLTLRLPRAYQLTGVGAIAYLQDGGADLKIEVSSNGQSWSTPARGARDGYLRPFAAPVSAQYVRISDPNPISKPLAAFLHELELYGS
ncbi:hypothetical protein [Microlunatus speluncae]|uniref:hypothetical protein n=1 Tax=Microlunatus speluncae TaxID=2594267 RepID=UPI0012662CEC|nr:hypothetical protein [Microlunatus speluncae]